MKAYKKIISVILVVVFVFTTMTSFTSVASDVETAFESDTPAAVSHTGETAEDGADGIQDHAGGTQAEQPQQEVPEQPQQEEPEVQAPAAATQMPDTESGNDTPGAQAAENGSEPKLGGCQITAKMLPLLTKMNRTRRMRQPQAARLINLMKMDSRLM